MRRDASRSYILAVCLVVAAFSACRSQPSTRILFVGNSYTFFNGGLDRQLKGLAPSVETASIVAGGYGLESHWRDGNALKAIREGKWDYVVLQEQSQAPVLFQRKFYEYARLFDGEIRRSGAKTILLMTWERPDSKNLGVTTESLTTAFATLGNALDAMVAPAGQAFARSLRDNPGLLLTSPDGHPTMEGTYLAACVLYRTIFGLSPVGIPFSPKSISKEMRTSIQRIASEIFHPL